MLDKCSVLAELLSFDFNVDKSHCIVIGKRSAGDITSVPPCGNPIEWCDSIKYLGVYLQHNNSVKFDINPIKRAFYGACNSIFLYGSGVDEVALLHLQETYCLSVIMYAMPSLYLNNRQINELNACRNNVIRRLFGYNKWESVSALLLELGRLNVKHLIMLCKVKFHRNLLHSCNTVLSGVFHVFIK